MKEAKVLKRILVHKSGKVIRVIDGEYNDITNDLYEGSHSETVQQHYEKMLADVVKPEVKVVKEEVKVEQPAPAPAPAPAPVVVNIVQNSAPVQEKPAPAPAPIPVVAAVEKAPVERIPFAKRLATSEKVIKEAYNEVKSELLSYGLKSRISMSGDTFRLHTIEYAKIVVAGKSLKMYLALNPKDYKDSPIPFSDASKMSAHKETPFVFKVKSGLSVRRAKQLIADLAAKNKFEQGEVVAHNHAKEVK